MNIMNGIEWFVRAKANLWSHLPLLFNIIIISIICIYFYIRAKYGFWAMQPVFHIYDFGYIWRPPGIIQLGMPERNKYTNFKNIDTIQVNELSSLQKQRFVDLIRRNYLRNKDNIFSPTAEQIFPYFVGHNVATYMSVYYVDQHLLDTRTGSLLTDRKIVGAITSRPMNIWFANAQAPKSQPLALVQSREASKPSLSAYYVDYLCVDVLHRKKGIAPQLIQTHNYNQRVLNPNILVSLFKREEELTGIVPLCAYTTYGFSVDTWTKPFDLSGEYTMLEINPQNYRFLHDFMELTKPQFDCVACVEVTNLIELIKTKNVFIYAVLCDNQILCCYFYRKSCVEIEKGLEVLSCFGSICNCEADIFIQGFKISFWKVAAEHLFGFAAIENIAHNNVILDNIMLRTKPKITSPTAYYFYNYAQASLKSNRILVIN